MSTATAARPVAESIKGGSHALVGTGTLVRFMLRRDRVRIPAWVGALTLFTVGSVSSTPDLFANESDLAARAELMQNPGTRAISGPGYGLDDYTIGAMIAHEYFSWVAIFVALMAILLIVRHTRAEEESGRAELVRSAVVGRHANTTAALIVVCGASLLTGLLIAAGIASLGLENVTAEGSWIFGIGLALVGVVFAGVAAVTAQINEHARTAGGLAGVVLALTYTLRAAGDMSQIGGNFLSWLSPIGWGQQTRMWVDDRWWPLLLSVVLTIILIGLAFALSVRRDFAAGLVQPRLGSPTATKSMGTPLGLAWRLQRSSAIWWTVAIVVFAFGYGGLASEIESFAEDFSMVEDMTEALGGATVIASFLSVIMSLMAVAVAVFAILSVQRLRSEETSGRAEPVLATATSRARLMASHVAIALVGSTIIVALTGLAIGSSAGSAVDDSDLVGDLFGAGLAYAPAIWVTVGVWVALFGLIPRATMLVWIVIAYAGVIGTYGPILGLPDWTQNLSPFGHVPTMPAEDMNWTPVLTLTAIAVVLLAIGLRAFQRRDLETK